MYNCSLFIVTTNHKGEGQVSYKYNKHVRQLKSLHIRMCKIVLQVPLPHGLPLYIALIPQSKALYMY